MDKHYEATQEFNITAGNLKSIYQAGEAYIKINNQLKYIESELKETVDAFDLPITNWVEVLDGAVDVKVTNDGLLQLLANLGCDVEKACELVGINNLSKFPTDKAVVDATLAANPTWSAEFTAVTSRWVIKNEYGKVMKPSNFVPVDLSECVPVTMGGLL
jgi:hypothetical protein